jgi:hypothetical protein
MSTTRIGVDIQQEKFPSMQAILLRLRQERKGIQHRRPNRMPGADPAIQVR